MGKEDFKVNTVGLEKLGEALEERKKIEDREGQEKEKLESVKEELDTEKEDVKNNPEISEGEKGPIVDGFSTEEERIRKLSTKELSDKLMTSMFPDIAPGGYTYENLKDSSLEELKLMLGDIDRRSDSESVRDYNVVTKIIKQKAEKIEKQAQEPTTNPDKPTEKKEPVPEDSDEVKKWKEDRGVGQSKYFNSAGEPITKAEFDAMNAAPVKSSPEKAVEKTLDDIAAEIGQDAKNQKMKAAREAVAKNTTDPVAAANAALAEMDQKINSAELKKPAESKDYTAEVHREMEALAWMKGKNAAFTTPSMLIAQERKIKNLINSGKIDSMEAELLKQEASKGKFEKQLGMYGDRVAEIAKKYKFDKAYGKYVSWVNDGNRYQKFAKRVLGSTVLGAGALLITGTGLTAAGVAGLGVYSAGRIAVSMGAAAGAGEIHKALTKKGVQKKIENLRDMRNTEYTEKKKTFLESGVRLNGAEIKKMRSLRNEKKLTPEQSAELGRLELKYQQYKNHMLRSRDNYRELKHKIEGKNERNRMFWSAAAGMGVGIGMGYTGFRADAIGETTNLSPKGPAATGSEYGPKNFDIEKSLLEKVSFTPEAYNPPQSAFIGKGEGITHAYLRQLQESADLREALGITGEPTARDAAKLATEHEYINGSRDIRVIDGFKAAYDLEIVDGKVEVIESIDGEPVGSTDKLMRKTIETHNQGTKFEGFDHDKYEYVGAGYQPEPEIDPEQYTAFEEKYEVSYEKPEAVAMEQTIEPEIDLGGLEEVETEPTIVDLSGATESVSEPVVEYSDRSPAQETPNYDLERQQMELERQKIALEKQRLAEYQKRMMEMQQRSSAPRQSWWKRTFVGRLLEGSANRFTGQLLETKANSIAGGWDVNVRGGGTTIINNIEQPAPSTPIETNPGGGGYHPADNTPGGGNSGGSNVRTPSRGKFGGF